MDRVPVFNIPAIVALRKRLVETVFLPRYHESPEGVQFEYLVDDLGLALGNKYNRDAVYETVRALVGIELTPQLCGEFAWRLAGNLPALAAGRPVLPWTGPRGNFWAPLQVMRVIHARDQRSDEFGSQVEFRVLAGDACPNVISRFLRRRYTNALARRIGFSKRNDQHFPYHDVRQLVNLRMVAMIDAAKSQFDLKFGEIRCPPSMFEHNREILRVRVRLQPCPQNWIHACHRCVVGYVNCIGGTHRLDYEKKFCSHCGMEAYFDPADINADRCVLCMDKQRTAKQG